MSYPSETNRLFRGFQLLTMQENVASFGLVTDGALAVSDGRIQWLGRADDVPAVWAAFPKVEGEGRFLSPGLIDCHTHLVWGGSRADEWEERIGGTSYAEIARRGGGILSTVKATRAASEEDLYSQARKRIEFLIRQGVTTVEIKSGYGLDLENELKLLRVITDLRDSMPIDVSRTFLGAHAVPAEFAGRPDAYVDLVCREMIPRAAELCEAVDVFCENIAFNLDQTERVFQAALKSNLAIKIHAEQLSNLGGAKLAAGYGAWSADHLEYLDAEGVQAMQEQDTVAVLLPGAFYFLNETQRPPVELLREQGIAMAIATDANPGSSPVSSLLLMMNMACTLFRLTPEEALAGVTRHAAKALRLSDRLGTLEVGKQADLAVWDISTPAELAYGIGHNPCVAVYKHGNLVFSLDP